MYQPEFKIAGLSVLLASLTATNFHFLTIEQITIYFLKDLMSGAKTPIYGPDVRHVTIPQYEGLGI